MSKLEGTALITGATGGIGQAIASTLADRGVFVVLSGRRADALEALARRTGGRVIVADLADRADVDRLAADAGEVDILVANAALPASGDLLDLSPEQIDRVLDVNLRAPIILARALAGPMVQRRRGHLVFIASLAGKAASAHSSLYSAGKFALRGFALGLREDLRPSGVEVSTVLPGFIREAGMFADAGVSLPWGVGTRTPGDVAAAVAHAIERNKAEVDVAPLLLRAGAAFAGLVPEVAARLQRGMGGERVASELSAAQRHKL